MVFFFKLLLIVLLVFIVINLGRALFEMVRDPEQDPDQSPKPMSHYLGRRVVLSALAVILLIVALLSGFIEPNGRPY
ncbi:DUF2909 domain-containing protein [Vibrio sp.]|uniref:DUF2909 domain-containing protein n=1 Tax=Vibrio sp. TaxID=678 RepID=UPI003D0FCEED